PLQVRMVEPPRGRVSARHPLWATQTGDEACAISCTAPGGQINRVQRTLLARKEGQNGDGASLVVRWGPLTGRPGPGGGRGRGLSGVGAGADRLVGEICDA